MLNLGAAAQQMQQVIALAAAAQAILNTSQPNLTPLNPGPSNNLTSTMTSSPGYI